MIDMNERTELSGCENVTPRYEFYIYKVGLCYASVCSSLPIEEVKRRMANDTFPTGVGPWTYTGEAFCTGEPNPCPCNEYPDTHKHYLFSC